MDTMEEQSFVDSATEWLSSSGLTILGIVVVIWLIRKFGNIVIRRTIRKAISPDKFSTPKDEQQREDTLISIIEATARVLLWVVGGMLIIQEFGVDIGPLVAGASVVGVAIGFGAQSLVKDFVSGLFIIMENQYRVGDVVNLAGEGGTVQAITMRETILRNLDGDVIHIPNGTIDVAKNMTMEFSKVVMDIGVGYDSDIKKVEKVINDVGEAMMKDEDWAEKIIDQPKYQRVQNFGANEVEVRIVAKVAPAQQWAVAGELRSRIKVAFDKNKIEIPFPQRVVHQAKK